MFVVHLGYFCDLVQSEFEPVCHFLPCLDRNISPHDSPPPLRCDSFTLTWRPRWTTRGGSTTDSSFLEFIGQKTKKKSVEIFFFVIKFLLLSQTRCSCTCELSPRFLEVNNTCKGEKNWTQIISPFFFVLYIRVVSLWVDSNLIFNSFYLQNLHQHH